MTAETATTTKDGESGTLSAETKSSASAVTSRSDKFTTVATGDPLATLSLGSAVLPVQKATMAISQSLSMSTLKSGASKGNLISYSTVLMVFFGAAASFVGCNWIASQGCSFLSSH